MVISRRNSQGSTKSVKKKNLEKISVYLEYACFVCGSILGSAKSSINHAKIIHGYVIPARPVGSRRPRNSKFEYVADQSGPWTIEEYACPSCWFHSPADDLEALNEHIREEHDPVKVENKNMDTANEEFSRSIANKLDELNELFRNILK